MITASSRNPLPEPQVEEFERLAPCSELEVDIRLKDDGAIRRLDLESDEITD